MIHKRSGKKIPFGGSNCSSRLSNRSFNSAIALNDVSKSRPNSGLWNPALDLDDVCIILNKRIVPHLREKGMEIHSCLFDFILVAFLICVPKFILSYKKAFVFTS